MARLDSWFAPDVMHALAWALIHSLWQALSVAALAAGLMASSRRPSVRYLIATGALALMLAAPVATFFLLMKPVPVSALLPANRVYAAAIHPSMTLGVPSTSKGVAIALENSPAHILPARFLSPDVLPSSLPPWLVGAWLGGVAFFSLRLAGGFLLLEHRRRKLSAAPGPHILALCHELQRQLGLTRAIRYLECRWLQTPAVIGLLRPVVLLPVTALIGLSEEQLRAVIAQELAHIRRLDAFVNLFQILAETLLFYHPAVWWLSRRIRAERELACDEIAVSLTGNRLEYARVLTLMAEWEKAPALAMAANRGPLTERVFHILGRKPSGAGQRMLGLTGSLLFLAAALGAANALFGIAYPIPAAHAKESVKAVLASSQSAVDRITRQVIQASAPAATKAPDDTRTAGDKPAPDQTQAAAQPETLIVPSPDLSRAVPSQIIPAQTLMASNDQSAARIELKEQAAIPVPQVNDEGAGPAIPGFNGSIARQCNNANVYGQVISPDTIRMPGFECYGGGFQGGGGWGACRSMRADRSYPETRYRDCPFSVTMKVQFANPADAGKMQPGKIVSLVGDVFVFTDPRVVPVTRLGGNLRTRISYLIAENSKITAAQDPPMGLVQADTNYWKAAQPATRDSSVPPGASQCQYTNVFPRGTQFDRVISPSGSQMLGFNC